MAGAPMTRGSFRAELLREGLYEVFGLGVERVETHISEAFHRVTSNQNYEEMVSMAGIGHFTLWPERTPITYQAISDRYKSRFTHLDYATGITYSRLAQRDLKYNVITESAQQFGMSLASTQEELGFNFLNNGFTTVWNTEEGQFFFDTDHPLDPRTGLTYSNDMGAVDPSYQTIEEAITLLEMTPNDMGYPMHIKATRVWIHPSKEWLWKEILGSQGRADTSDRADNVLRNRLSIVSTPYITNQNAWFIQGDYFRTYWFDRETMQQDMETDFDTGDIKHKAWFSASVGAADWRGWVGATGS